MITHNKQINYMFFIFISFMHISLLHSMEKEFTEEELFEKFSFHVKVSVQEGASQQFKDHISTVEVRNQLNHPLTVALDYKEKEYENQNELITLASCVLANNEKQIFVLCNTSLGKLFITALHDNLNKQCTSALYIEIPGPDKIITFLCNNQGYLDYTMHTAE